MWVLTVRGPVGATEYILIGGTTYTLGRGDADVILPDDSSISRAHCVISPLPATAAEMANPGAAPAILIADRSKHGTFVNGERVGSSDGGRPLRPGDTIVCGRRVKLDLLYWPVLVTLSRALADTAALHDVVAKLGGTCTADVIPSSDIVAVGVCPAVRCLVTVEVLTTAEFVIAAVEQVSLVHPDYLPALLAGVSERPARPWASLPHPQFFEPPRCPALNGVSYVRPEPAILDPKNSPLTAASAAAASTCRGRVFGFLDDSFGVQLLPFVERSGGRAFLLSMAKALSWDPSEGTAALPLKGLVPPAHAHGVGVALVVPPGWHSVITEHMSLSTPAEEDTVRAVCRLLRRGCTVVAGENLMIGAVTRNLAEHFAVGAAGVLQLASLPAAVMSDAGSDDEATTDGEVTPYRIEACARPAEQLVAAPKRRAEEKHEALSDPRLALYTRFQQHLGAR